MLFCYVWHLIKQSKNPTCLFKVHNLHATMALRNHDLYKIQRTHNHDSESVYLPASREWPIFRLVKSK